MNLGFSGFYGGYDQGFRFELVGVTRTDTTPTGSMPVRRRRVSAL